MEDCIFCKIIKGEIPSKKVYEDEYTYAFMDIAKDVDGHMLVIPKTHCTSMLECSAQDLGHVMETVQKISRHCVEDCGYDGVNLLNCTREIAGQSVFHFHMHIIPRKAGDGLPPVPKYTGAKRDLDEVFNEIKMQ